MGNTVCEINALDAVQIISLIKVKRKEHLKKKTNNIKMRERKKCAHTQYTTATITPFGRTILQRDERDPCYSFTHFFDIHIECNFRRATRAIKTQQQHHQSNTTRKKKLSCNRWLDLIKPASAHTQFEEHFLMGIHTSPLTPTPPPPPSPSSSKCSFSSSHICQNK